MNIINACISAGSVRLFSSYFFFFCVLFFALSTYLLASRSLLSCVAGDGGRREKDNRSAGSLYPSCRLRWQHVSLLLLNYMPNRIKVFPSCFGLLSPSVEAVDVDVGAGAGKKEQQY